MSDPVYVIAQAIYTAWNEDKVHNLPFLPTTVRDALSEYIVIELALKGYPL